MDRALGPDYNDLAPADKLYHAQEVRRALVDRHDMARDKQLAIDTAYQAGSYDQEDLLYVDSRIKEAASEFYENQPEEFIDQLKSVIAERMPSLQDTSVSVGDYKMNLLKRYDRDQQVMLSTIYKRDGIDACNNSYSEIIQETYDDRLARRRQQETQVLESDKSAEWGIDNLSLEPIKEDPNFIQIAEAHPRPAEADQIADKLVLETLKIFVDPNNYKLRISTDDYMSLERSMQEMLDAWQSSFGAAIQPLIEARYDQLKDVYNDSNYSLFIDQEAERASGQLIAIGRTILPVIAIVAGVYDDDWRLLNGKTGVGSGNHSPTTIKDIATRLITGGYTEANQYGDNGRVYAYHCSEGGIVYEVEGGAHRVAAHKLLGKKTIVLGGYVPDADVAIRLEQARV